MPVRLLVCAAIAAALALPASALGWAWPVQGPVLRPFLFGDDPYSVGQHRGIDIGAATGTPVMAPAAGVVSFAGTVPVSGHVVSIRTPDGYSVTLVHLGSVEVQRGKTVVEGGLVGTVGPSGEAELSVPMSISASGEAPSRTGISTRCSSCPPPSKRRPCRLKRKGSLLPRPIPGRQSLPRLRRPPTPHPRRVRRPSRLK